MAVLSKPLWTSDSPRKFDLKKYYWTLLENFIPVGPHFKKYWFKQQLSQELPLIKRMIETIADRSPWRNGFLLKSIKSEMIQACQITRQSLDGVILSCKGVALDVNLDHSRTKQGRWWIHNLAKSGPVIPSISITIFLLNGEIARTSK